MGGGDFATGADRGYAAIVSKSAIERALPEVRPSTVHLPLLWFNVDPDPYDNFWFVNSTC